MAKTNNQIGTRDDVVRIELNNDAVEIAESYEVRVSILRQPNSFTIRLGSGDLARVLLARYPHGTPFALFIGGNPQFSGFTHKVGAEGSTGATEVTLSGRDWLAVLHDKQIRDVKSYTDASAVDLVKYQLAEVDMAARSVVGDDSATRSIRTGVGVSAFTPSPAPGAVGAPIPGDTTFSKYPTASAYAHAIAAKFLPGFEHGDALTYSQAFDVALADWNKWQATKAKVAAIKAGTIPNPNIVRYSISTEVGKTRLAFLMEHLAHAGLVLRGTATGEFIVAGINPNQSPLFRLARQRGTSANAVNIERASFYDDASEQIDTCTIWGRNPGKKKGRGRVRGHVKGEADDTDVGNGFREVVLRDMHATSPDDAALMGKRMIAEAARQGWHLSYVVSGHSQRTLLPGGPWGVLCADIIVDVQDDEFGIHGPMYVETCTYRRSSDGTTTELNLVRPTDIVLST